MSLDLINLVISAFLYQRSKDRPRKISKVLRGPFGNSYCVARGRAARICSSTSGSALVAPPLVESSLLSQLRSELTQPTQILPPEVHITCDWSRFALHTRSGNDSCSGPKQCAPRPWSKPQPHSMHRLRRGSAATCGIWFWELTEEHQLGGRLIRIAAVCITFLFVEAYYLNSLPMEKWSKLTLYWMNCSIFILSLDYMQCYFTPIFFISL